MRKTDFPLGENKDTDQLRSNFKADQCLCFRYTDSTIPHLLKTGNSVFRPVCVGPGQKPLKPFSRVTAHFTDNKWVTMLASLLKILYFSFRRLFMRAHLNHHDFASELNGVFSS